MDITQKIIASIILMVLVVATIMPTVQAVTEEVSQNGTQEEILYQQEDNVNTQESNIPTNFEVLLAYILSTKEGTSEDKLLLSDIPSIILQKPSKNGVWIEEQSRDYVINLINSLTNKNYKIDADGYLIENLDLTKDLLEIKEENNFFTKKIDEMISKDSLTIISINDTYAQLNDIDKDIINIRIEKDEYALLFKEKENEDNKQNIIILNSQNYNENNTNDTQKHLLEKFLETYFYNDKEFLDYINSKNEEIKDNIDKDSNTNEDNIIENTDNENTETIIEKDNIFDDRVTERDWNLILAGILSNNSDINSENIDQILQSKPTDTGIWISPNSRNSFINFLNQYTIYTYSVNSDGFLVCDNIMRTNDNLDLIENSETDVDIVVKRLMESDKLLVIDLSNSYLQYDDNNAIITKQLEQKDYGISFSFNENRILLLNPLYYNTEEYNLALSDYMLKAMQNIQEKVLSGKIHISKENVLTRSSRDILGYSESAQTVYSGPDSSNYSSIGSIIAGEKLYILGTSAGWYHIQYVISGTDNGDHVELEKAGYIPIGSLSSISGTPSEEQFTVGQAYPQQGLNVQTCDDFDISTKLGSVSAGEGVTILYDYGYSDWTGKSYRVAFIEYSTASGTKRGYVYKDQLDNASYPTSVARVMDTNSAYSGPDNSYVKLGGAYYNEYVTILAKNTGNDWVFVEYNTSTGRKRGYMLYTKLSNCNHPGMYNDLAVNQRFKTSNTRIDSIWWSW